MSRQSEDFWKPYPGLTLIQNPKKTKRRGLDILFKTTPLRVEPHTQAHYTDDLMSEFRSHVHQCLEGFDIPLTTSKRMDPISTLLEAAYYQYLGHRGVQASTPPDKAYPSANETSVDEESVDHESADQTPVEEHSITSSLTDDQSSDLEETLLANTS